MQIDTVKLTPSSAVATAHRMTG